MTCSPLGRPWGDAIAREPELGPVILGEINDVRREERLDRKYPGWEAG